MKNEPRSDCRILVVDDNVDAADSLVALLGALGFDACAAYDGRRAVQLAESLRPRLIILDIQMPDMDGFETAACIRGAEGQHRTCLVALTGDLHDLDPVLADCIGFDEFILKPVTGRRLRQLASVAYR
ncbi:MAG: response regulator [Rubrivivax sp.]|nr:MAG: response regulator [Rubrivivax sp.]